MNNKNTGWECPLPISEYPHILLAHGGGGKLMHRLIDKVFEPAFENLQLETKLDSSILNMHGGKLAFTTDSYVVSPLFFPGGDIGSLAVYGTVNDLAMCGARPLYLSVGFIIEEGFPVESLWRIALSMCEAAEKADVKITTGDTKVVDRGHGNGVYINTAGIGAIEHRLSIGPAAIMPGDQIIINGDIGRHGMAVLSQRESLDFESGLESDCAPLAQTVLELIDEGVQIHCLRDLTRGGLSSALAEIAGNSKLHFGLSEETIPVCREVKAICEILGFEPIHVANEGRFIAFISSEDSSKALEILKSKSNWPDACIIGEVTDDKSGMVTMKTPLGTERIIDMLSGEMLPRIC